MSDIINLAVKTQMIIFQQALLYLSSWIWPINNSKQCWVRFDIQQESWKENRRRQNKNLSF